MGDRVEKSQDRAEESDTQLGGKDPPEPSAETVDQGRPQNLQTPGQAQKAEKPDLFQGDIIHPEVNGEEIVNEAERKPLGKVEEAYDEEFRPGGRQFLHLPNTECGVRNAEWKHPLPFRMRNAEWK